MVDGGSARVDGLGHLAFVTDDDCSMRASNGGGIGGAENGSK